MSPPITHRGGSYPVDVFVKQYNSDSSKEVTLTFNIKVIPADGSEEWLLDESEESETILDVFAEQDLTDEERTQAEKLYQLFGARIITVSLMGKVTVRFNDPILVPNIDYEEIFNETVLDVSVIAGSYSNQNDLSFTWKCSGLNAKTMTLQLYFDKPEMVSFNVCSLYL